MAKVDYSSIPNFKEYPETGYHSNTPNSNCPYCGFNHEVYDKTLCPRISEIEYHPDGTVKKVILGSAGHLHVK